MGVFYQPASSWNNFMMKPTRSPISAVIGAVTSPDNPDKLSGNWCVYASSASTPDNQIQAMEVPLHLSRLTTSTALKNTNTKLILNMSDRIFQFLPNTRNEKVTFVF